MNGSMRIVVVSASSVVPQLELLDGVEAIRAEGFEVRVHPQCFQRHFTYAGTDAQRAGAFWEAANEAGSEVVWMAGGGYGATRILPTLAELTTRHGPPRRKLLVGYSDVTALHEFVRSRWNWATLHAAMPSSAEFKTFDRAHWRALIDLIRRRRPGAVWGDKPLRWLTSNRAAPLVEMEARLVGGNLAMLAAMAGTAFLTKPASGDVLFLEDIAEPFYRIDRMVTQIRGAGLLENISAIVLGDFTDCDDDKVKRVRSVSGEPVPIRPRYTLNEALLEIFGSLGVPVATGLPVGHGPHFAPLPLGARYRIGSDGGFTLVDWDWLL